MERQFEFGADTRALEMERLLKKRKTTRTMVIITGILALAIAVFAFRKDIQEVTQSGGKKDKSMIAGSEINQESGTDNSINIARKWDMPAQLLEISGLSWMDADRVACVQDEEGIVFIYNLKTENVEKQVSFAGPGDYEGLALVGEAAWVIRSDGRLFEISNLNAAKPAVKEYQTPLTAEHNSEGLCYDQKNNRLLVAIKDNDPERKGKKGIYSFDLSAKKMAASPILSIDLSDKHVISAASSSKKKAKEGNVFMPSAIAIHPVSGDLYITEGRNPKLMVMNSGGTVKSVYSLDKSDFTQPEGITFSSSGTMYISNEGTKKPGNILEVSIR